MSNYDWSLYLKFSMKILDSSDFEFDKQTVARVAISRAYYAAFHAAKDYLQTNKYEILYASGDHDKVCKGYKEMKKETKEFQSKCRSIGNMLGSLKKDRVNSDYHADVELNKKVADKSCKFAIRIIEEINKLDNLKTASKG